jgi:hypothetical protein
MILNMPTWITGKANRFVWYKHAIFCFALPTAKTKIADKLTIASNSGRISPFKHKQVQHFFYHLHCAISGPG